MRMKDKICIVTGGASGIGRAIVEKLASEGAELVLACDIDHAGAKKLATVFPNVKGISLNVSDVNAIASFAREIRDKYKHLDVLINNAGIIRDSLITKMTDEEWDRVMEINLRGVFLMNRAFAPLMLEMGKGSIINLASVVGMDGNMGQSNYAASKGGVIAMTKSLSKELSRKGAQIRVNAVAPGFIKTAMTEAVPEKVVAFMVAKTPLKRMGEAGEVADLVHFLASDESAFITGQVIRVDGGLVI